MSLPALAFAVTLASAGGTDARAAPPDVIACETRGQVWDYASAIESRNLARQQELLRQGCDRVGGEPYRLVADHDGVAQIRIFPTDSWADSRLVYTLDDMLQLD